jgi:hypothetical protein
VLAAMFPFEYLSWSLRVALIDLNELSHHNTVTLVELSRTAEALEEPWFESM